MRRDGASAGALISSPTLDAKLLFFKFYFECKNNVGECESLVLGLNFLNTMKVKKIATYGDLELVIDQVKGFYLVKHPKMRAY